MKELSVEQKAKRYDEVIELVNSKWHYRNQPCIIDVSEIFTELKESEDKQSKKWILEYLYDGLRKSDEQFKGQFKAAVAWLEKQGEQKSAKNILEAWKDMRLEVYQQASGNRHEPNYSDDTTKMFSLNDIDEIIEKNE